MLPSGKSSCNQRTLTKTLNLKKTTTQIKDKCTAAINGTSSSDQGALTTTNGKRSLVIYREIQLQQPMERDLQSDLQGTSTITTNVRDLW